MELKTLVFETYGDHNTVPSSGADTAIVCKPAYPRTFHQLEIREILAKPRIP